MKLQLALWFGLAGSLYEVGYEFVREKLFFVFWVPLLLRA
jgi:hypothetical protein